MMPSKPLLFAHRGDHRLHGENTLEAFALAEIRAGVETDLYMTKDKRIICTHNARLRLGLRRRKVSELQYVELPDSIPTIEEAISVIGTARPISMDLKDRVFGAEMITSVTKHYVDVGGLRENLWFCCEGEDMAFLESCVGVTEGANIVQSIRLAAVEKKLERHVAHLANMGVAALNMPADDWTKGLVSLCHRFNIQAFLHSAHYERELLHAKQCGVDGLYSDDLETMLNVFSP